MSLVRFYLTPYMATALLGNLTSDSHSPHPPDYSQGTQVKSCRQVIPLSSCNPETMSSCLGRVGDLLQPIASPVNNGHAAAPAHQAPEYCPKMHFWGTCLAQLLRFRPRSEVEWATEHAGKVAIPSRTVG
jgi:hypothetical protein